MMNHRRLLNRNRVTATAARNENTSAMTTVSKVTVSEFTTAGRNGVRPGSNRTSA